MNERIRELAQEAGDSISEFHFGDYNIPNEFIEKFAELIVRECAGVADDWYRNHDKIHSDPMSYVLAHFGVEE